ncbi:MAG: Sensor histidine kinase TmoS [Candidatus Heimdallarchaeota archaeon LC_3]|nr:MAG: Sensor histidine kinase TmoS [Candidatus Heimdallarchaeota archaeon LC_3]
MIFLNSAKTDFIRILLLDDNESFLDLTKIYLTKESQERLIIDTLADSTKLFDVINEREYDVLISDYEMPEKNGLEILAEIRKNPIYSGLPVIIFTGRGREEVCIEALNLGADYYINKGTDIKSRYKELIHTIYSVVNKKRTEQALKESEEKYRLIFENNEDAILILDLETKRFFDVNPAAERMYGYIREDFLKLHVKDITVEMDKTSEVLNKIKDEKIVIVPHRLNRKKDGSVFTVEFKSSSFRYKNRNYLATIVRDISDKIQKELQLKESEEKFRELFEDIPTPSYEWDVSGAKSFIEKIKKQFPETYKTEIMKLSNYYEINKRMKISRVNKAGMFRVGNRTLDEFNKDRYESLKGLFNENKKYAYDMIRYFVENIITQEFETELKDKNKIIYLRVSIFIPQANRDKFDVVWMRINDITQTVIERKRVAESERKSKAILKALPDLLFQLDKNGKHLSFQGSKKDLFIKSELFIGKTVSETLPEHVAEIYMYNIEKTLRSKETSSFEYSLPFKTGIRYYEARMVENGVDQVLTIVRNVTEQTKTKNALIESESKYHNLIDNIPAVSWISDESGKTIFISSNVYQVYGYSEQEIIKGGEELWFGRIHPDDLESVTNRYQLLFENKDEFNIEYRIQRKDGKWIWLHDKAISTELKGGINIAYGVFMDITDRKHAEIQNEAMLSAIPDMFFRMDRDTKIISFRGAEESLYLPPDEFLGKTCFDVLPKDVASMFKENIEYLFESENEITKFEYSLSLKDQPHYYEARMVINGIEEVLAIVRDITDRIMDKKELKKSEWKLKSLFEQSPIAQSIRDYSGVKSHLNTLRNKGIVNLKEYLENNQDELLSIIRKIKVINVNQATLDEIEGKSIEEFEKLTIYFDPKSQPYLIPVYIQIFLGIDENKFEQSFLLNLKIKNGLEKTFNIIQIVPEEYRENYAWVWVKYLNITELEKSKKTLAENENKYNIIFDLVDDGVCILDKDVIIDCNNAMVRLFGHKSKETIIGKSIIEFAPKTQPDGQYSFAKIVEKISQAFFGEEQKFLFRHKKAVNQKIFDAEIKLKTIKLGNNDLLFGVIRPYDFKY